MTPDDLPVWFGDSHHVLWSDIPDNRIMRWDGETGTVGVFRHHSGYANGNTRDRQGRLVTGKHGGRRVIRTEHDGTVTVLMDSWDGKRLNSPNDVVVESDGSIWFTDPPFGIRTHYEGNVADQEIPAHVYRLDPATDAATIVQDTVLGSNGLCFSPDESRLCIVESRGVPSPFSTASGTVAALRAGQLEAAVNIDETAREMEQKGIAKVWLHGLSGTDITFAVCDRELAQEAALVALARMCRAGGAVGTRAIIRVDLPRHAPAGAARADLHRLAAGRIQVRRGGLRLGARLSCRFRPGSAAPGPAETSWRSRQG